MREVSCRTLGVLLKAARRQGISSSAIIAGSGYSLAHLANPKEHIEWTAFTRILRNARSYWTPEELSALNEAFMRSPFFAYVGVIARLLFSARDLFDWICKRTVGAGAQLFSQAVKPSYEHVGAATTIVKLVIQPGYEPSDEFFWMTRGAFVSMPRLVHAGDADVRMDIDGNTATYTIRYKVRNKTLAGLVSMLAMPLTARRVARELQRSNEHLHERFLELEEARSKLARQATHLRTAHSVNELVQRDLAIDATLSTVASALHEQAGFRRARVELSGQPIRTADAGDPDATISLIRPILTRGGHCIGELAVAVRHDLDEAHQVELLDFTLPSIAMAIENAMYRTSLEQQVDQRTAELSQARDALAGTVKELQAAQGVRERFFGNISHEIRTPLSLILLATADIERRAGHALDPRARDGLGAVTDSAKKLVRLVDELLLLAAGQEGKLSIQPKPTELAGLVARIGEAWRPKAEHERHTLTITVPSRLLARVDPVAIDRIVTNLVSNAIKYTPPGGSVVVELHDETAGIRLSVLDTGPGIDAELAGRLFGRFQRAAGEHRRVQGTGLGLALAKELVDAHGGTISAHPRSTGGTELQVMLPASCRLDAGGAASVAHASRALELPVSIPLVAACKLEPAGISKGVVLLAEDDTRLAAAVANLLADEYTVLVAHDGVAALELARLHKPQLLVTDVDMPNMNGIELARRFRDVMEDVAAPVIILSAVLDLRTRIEGLDAGAVDYVTKPFEPVELMARVRSQLRMRDLSTRLHRAEQLATLSFLTSGLAHELRNPANGIVNAVEPILRLLPAELKAPEHPVAQLLSVVQECSEQIGFLSRQLLGFRRKDAVLALESVPLKVMLDRAAALASRSLADVQLKLDLPARLELQCAPQLLAQVLTNLLENAAQAAGPGGWVSVRAIEQGGCVTVEVTDSGPGVPLDLRDKVFEPFFTTKPLGVGNGLGLPLSRDIVMQHRGVLEIRGEAAATAFVIELPVPGLASAANAL